MQEEEIVINNSILYKDSKPFKYKNIDISYILLHKLAGYNGMMHNYSEIIIEAEKTYKKRPIIIEKYPKNCDLKKLIILNQCKQDSLIFFVKNYQRLINDFHNNLEQYYNSAEYIPLEVDLRNLDSYEYDYKKFKSGSYLFLATMNNYLNPMVPIINELIKRGEQVVLLLPANAINWENYTKISNCEILFLEFLFSRKIKENFLYLCNNIELFFNKSTPTFRKNVRHKELKYFDVFVRNYKEVYINYIPHVCAYIDICDFLINAISPKSLFVSRLRRSVEISFNEVFKKYGLTSSMIIHGHISDEDSRFFTDGYFDSVNSIFVWDKLQKTKLLNKKYQSINPDSIYAYGNPIADEIVFKKKNKLFLGKEKIQSKLKITKDYLLLITQDFDIMGYKKAIKAILNNTKYDLVIKVHPYEDENRYLDFQNNQRIAVVKKCVDFDLYSLMYNSKIVMTHSSTAGMEAVYCGKIVISLLFEDFNSNPVLYDMKNYGMPIAFDENELIKHINIFSGKNYKIDRKYSISKRITDKIMAIN